MALTRGLLLIVVALGSAVDRASAAELPTVKPVMACADLLARDFSYLGDAPTKLNSATMVSEGAASSYCLVDGYVAPGVEFQVRLPTEHWTQRLLMQGCGGYCGNLLSLPVSGAPSASAGASGSSRANSPSPVTTVATSGQRIAAISCVRSPTVPGPSAILPHWSIYFTNPTARPPSP